MEGWISGSNCDVWTFQEQSEVEGTDLHQSCKVSAMHLEAENHRIKEEQSATGWFDKHWQIEQLVIRQLVSRQSSLGKLEPEAWLSTPGPTIFSRIWLGPGFNLSGIQLQLSEVQTLNPTAVRTFRANTLALDNRPQGPTVHSVQHPLFPMGRGGVSKKWYAPQCVLALFYNSAPWHRELLAEITKHCKAMLGKGKGNQFCLWQITFMPL